METLIAKDAFPYYEEILSPGGGIQTELPILLAEYPFTTPRDVKDYLALLGRIPDYLQEAAEYENGKSGQGFYAGLCFRQYHFSIGGADRRQRESFFDPYFSQPH